MASAHCPGTEGAVGPGLWVRNKEQWADRGRRLPILHVCVKEPRVRSDVLKGSGDSVPRS